MDNDTHPDLEVPERAKRRQFTTAYKARILAEYEALPAGAKGALLRREGLYSSLITEWRHQAGAGAAEGLARNKRGPKASSVEQREVERLEADNAQLRDELGRAPKVIDVQGKVSALLNELSKSADTDPRSTS